MSPTWMAIGAICLYALGNNFVAKHLRGNVPAANTLFVSLVIAAGAGVVLAAEHATSRAAQPTPLAHWWVFLACGICFCTADLLFYGAYSRQGSITLLTTLVALMPVAAVAIEYFFFKGSAPSIRQSAGIACAVLAAWLVSTR